MPPDDSANHASHASHASHPTQGGARRTPDAPDEPRAQVLALLRAHAWNATSFQVLEDGFLYAFDELEDGCAAYVETVGGWVVAGAPIAREASYGAVVARLIARAREAGRRISFFAVEERFLGATGLPSIRIGEQPAWDPEAWDATVRSPGGKSLREQLRRARAKGVVVRRVAAGAIADVEAPERKAVEALIARWLGSRGMAPMGFLVAVQPFAFAEERRYFVAEQAGRVVAFLAAVPVYARDGWLLEDLLRDPAAPNGTAELVVDFAMRTLAEEGSHYVTLGLAPLAGASGWLRVVKEWTRALYDFEGVRAFKAKLRPHTWEPIYLAYPPGASANVALFDALAAFARGSFGRFGAETLLHGPAMVVRALAALLLPWTLGLALAPAHWFPFAWAQWVWVAFDVAIALALFALAARWRWWLGRALAIAVTIDAVTTWGETLAWNSARARDPLDWLVIAVACAAPTVAAIILWGALGHREWMKGGPPLLERGALASQSRPPRPPAPR